METPNSKKIVTSSAGIVTPKMHKPKSHISEIEVRPPIIIDKTTTSEPSTEDEEVKVVKSAGKSESKFKKRFMNRLPLNSGKIEDAGDYQWIHRPTVMIDLQHMQQLYVQLQSWNVNLDDLVLRLSKPT